MSLAIGQTLGPYTIIAPIGAGGMGEVYRARDTRLNREVALKILPDTFAADAGRVARFRREAQLLATLNHPHIAQIYGFEEVTPQSAPTVSSATIVMELVEGHTLAERLVEGRLPLDETIAIARQIADALESAHDGGIIHRDLKPANIKIKDDGTVKVLDFGLAKALEPPATAAINALSSPTLSLQATQAGVILGTAAYMAPEQAKGRHLDRRADIWAFGVVLYEMLCGRRLFEAEDVSETLAAVLRQPVDWSALPADTPPALRHLLARCVERDVRKRLRDIGEARIALEAPSATVALPPAESGNLAVEPRRRGWQRMLPLGIAIVLAASITALAVRYLTPRPLAPVVRFGYPLVAGFPGAPLARPFLTISPDGTQIAYVYGTNRQLYVRRFSEIDPQAVPGTDGLGDIFAPAFSPDGRMLAFWSGDGTIKRVPIEGGAVVTICQADNPYGLSWGDSGIVFAQGDKGVIMRVSPNGGTPEVIARAKPREFVSGPELLPGGRFVLFSVTADTAVDRWDRARIVARSLDSGAEHIIVDGGSDARYLPSGYLVFTRGSVLFAAPFDASRAALKGPESPVLSGVRRGNPGIGTAHYAVSSAGTLVYVPGALAATATVDLGLVDRTGNVTRLKLPLGAYSSPRISPDGRQLAFTVAAGREEFIAVYELSGAKAMRRLTMGSRSRSPVWAANGTRVAYQSDREGDAAIFWQSADGGGTAERLTKPSPGESHVPESWSPTTNTLLFSVRKESEDTLWTLSLTDRKVAAFGAVRSSIPINAVYSPDGKWIAYQSDQGGRTTMYVQPVPPSGAVYQFLPRGNDVPHEPMWSPDSKELFYNPRAGAFEVVAVSSDPQFDFGNPVALPRPFRLTPPEGRRAYDVAPDGRIVGVILPTGGDESVGAQVLAVVLNWQEELKAKLGTATP
ncbi:MAG TPA: protein kinase [Vicinamibacterales bacterium]